MQQTTGVAVLATHLAGTDRRALSQAWYSALHLADHAPRARSPVRCAATLRVSGSGAPRLGRGSNESPEAFAQRDGARARRGATRAAMPRRDPSACDPERRAPKSELAGRIERALARQVARAPVASFALRAADGRVHLVVRADGVRTRVVAVCAPPLRGRVERALAQARFALAGRGLRAEAA